MSLTDDAARLDPAELRSLDAARRHGVAVAHPGWPPTERNSSL
ncbi:MAG: hypothetical protein ACRDQY_21075 [Pseudonocardiaceae bacterium]